MRPCLRKPRSSLSECETERPDGISIVRSGFAQSLHSERANRAGIAKAFVGAYAVGHRRWRMQKVISMQPILVNGSWQAAQSVDSFSAFDPTTGESLPESFPISGWSDCEAILQAADAAAIAMRQLAPPAIADFLDDYAAAIDQSADDVCRLAARETGLPFQPRLKDVELKRTTDQLRQAAAAARDGSWSMPTIDRPNQLRSYLAPVGPVVVFGPNNFPLAFNAIAGGDFAAAIAAGNPVIAKAHPSHPGTSRKLAELAAITLAGSSLPRAACQMLYHLPPEIGIRLVTDRRVGAVAFTGSKPSGLALKSACDAVGKPIYLEMSSLNPVVLLPGALRERGAEIAEQLFASCTAAAGQMCTSPGLVFVVSDPAASAFGGRVVQRFRESTPGTLLSPTVLKSLDENIQRVVASGADLVTGGRPIPGKRLAFENTLLRTSGWEFLKKSDAFQTEMFGTATLLVTAADSSELIAALQCLQASLTAAIYSSTAGADDSLYREVAGVLRPKVGRMMNDKMPTGVVVSPAMQHGGPFPATGHAGFTSVGIPASLRRFAMLQCFDHVREQRLPPTLRDQNPNGKMLRCIDGRWTTDNV